ncbi:MAG: PIN domain-containing protein [Limisphaerales bacterium]
MSATADLLDVNVWLALAVEGHPHHKAALKAWSQLTRPSFCRLTHLGFLRLLAAFEELGRNGAVELLPEPAGLDPRLKQIAIRAKAARDFWTDAYLAAFAYCAGLRLISFDAGFTRYKDLPCLLLDSGR